MKYLVAILAVVALGGVFGTANATPINNSYSVNLWYINCGANKFDGDCHKGRVKAGPKRQALPSNPLASEHKLATFDYTGDINFDAPKGAGNNSIGYFLKSAGGSISNFSAGYGLSQNNIYNRKVSRSDFKALTLLEFTGMADTGVTGDVTHDDGASLFQGGSNLLSTGAAAPTSARTDSFSLDSGSFNLWYVATNGLPEILKFTNIVGESNAVPEPSDIAMLALGLGLIGFGVGTKRLQRRKMKLV